MRRVEPISGGSAASAAHFRIKNSGKIAAEQWAPPLFLPASNRRRSGIAAEKRHVDK
jgi:hypothetical protein